MVFNTERWDQNFFLFCLRGGDRNFFLVCKGVDQFFYHGQRGGPEKIGDSSSQIDAPPPRQK